MARSEDLWPLAGHSQVQLQASRPIFLERVLARTLKNRMQPGLNLSAGEEINRYQNAYKNCTL